MKTLLDNMVLAANRAGLYQAYSLRQQFPNEWRQLQQAGTTQLTLESRHFPFFAQGHSPTIAKVIWCAPSPAECTDPQLVLPGTPSLSRDPNMPQLFVGTSGSLCPVELGVSFPVGSGDPAVVEDLIIVVQYTISQ